MSRTIAKLVVRRPSSSAPREKPDSTQVIPVVTRNELLERCRDPEERDPDATVVEDAELEIIVEPTE